MTDAVLKGKGERKKIGRPYKGIPVTSILISHTIHTIAKKNAAGKKISITEWLTNIIDSFDGVSNAELELALAMLTPRLYCWHKPWKTVYVSTNAYQKLQKYCEHLNENLPPGTIRKRGLKYGVRASNLLSAMVLDTTSEFKRAEVIDFKFKKLPNLD